ncbi:MAG TPA: AMP-binding protein [Acidisphaera sp.]|nr:AMP-binding protein [Acidisphaera sp.]
MERIWLKSYPQGVPAEADIHAFRSLVEMFDRCVAEYGTRTAFISMGTRLSYRDLDRLSAQFGAWLQQVARLQAGARVAVMMPNLLQYPICVCGTLRAGGVVVNCNPLYTPRELEHQLIDAGAEAIVVAETCAWAVQEVLARTQVKHVIVTSVGEMLHMPRALLVDFVVRRVRRMVKPYRIPGANSLRGALSRGRSATFKPADPSPDDIAFLQYTGGTTGVPKGAMLTHGNLVANVEQSCAWFKPVMRPGQEMGLTPLPMYHIFALELTLLFFRIGAPNVVVIDPRNLPALIAELRRYKITAMGAVNTLYNALANHPDLANVDFSALRLCVSGGMATHRAVAERWHKVSGRPIIEAYGLTETSPAATCNRLDIEEYSGTIGLPLPSTLVAMRDDDGKDVPIGERGELCISGPQVMKGYWNRPEETAKTMTPDGFVRTGDIAVMDEQGYIRIVDRKKDMIIVSGFNIFPSEIEQVVSMLPGVLDVGAVGVPDEVSGEAVMIFVIKRDQSLTKAAVILHCRQNLTGYKVPRHVAFADDLPRTTVGKILRRALREMAATWVDPDA